VGSMVVGVVALLFSFIPCVGMVSVPLSGLGLMLGMLGGGVALLRRGRGIGFPVAGSAINVMALLIGLFWVRLATETTSSWADAARRANQTIQTRDGPKDGTPASGEKQPPGGQEPVWAD